MKQKGFTISEILLALAVVGIISALVVPGMVNSSNNRQLETAFKKIYAELSSATEKVVSNNGGTLKDSMANTNNALANRFAEQLKFISICYENQGSGNCWHTANNWKYLDGSKNNNDPATTTARAILKNGMFASFQVINENCTSNNFVENSQNIFCAELNVDVNGLDKPNIIGRDIFSFKITKFGLYPAGSIGDSQYANTSISCNSTNSTSGWGCAGNITKQGGIKY